MKNKKMIVLFFLLICLCLAGGWIFQEFFWTQSGSQRNSTDIETAYNVDQEVAQALEQMKSNQKKATVIAPGTSSQRHIALTFDGLTDRMTVQGILTLLKKYDAKATFFVDGMQTAEDPGIVVNIKNEGQRVENYTLVGMGKMENLPVERLVNDFCRAQKIIKVTTEQGPNLLKCNDTNYTDQILQAAEACGFNGVVKNDAFLQVKQINSLSAADDFVMKIKPGSIVSVKLKTTVDPFIYEQGKTDLTPAVDKQPGLKDLSRSADLEEKETIDAVERLLIALKKANYTTIYVEDFSKSNIISMKTLRTNNIKDAKKSDGCASLVNFVFLITEQFKDLFTFRTAYAAELVDNRAKEIKMISTTETALSYTFAGLTKEAVVNDTLGRLHKLGIKATFFVTETEMKKYPATIRKILENGHEIGLAIKPKQEQTLEEASQMIMRGRKTLQEQFGVTTDLIKQPLDAVTDTTKEAVANLGCNLIGQSLNVVQKKHKDYISADQVMTEIFGKAVVSLGRGQIIYFKMDYYTNDQLIGDLVEVIKQRKIDNIAYATVYDNPAHNPGNDSQYVIKPVGEILHNTKFIYQYPVEPSKMVARIQNTGTEITIDKHNFLFEASKRYIGNAEVNYENRMLGFSKMDVRRLDKSGFVHTEDNVLFLTFDDWGSDAAVNKILYVLRKHNVTGTFFVLTSNVFNNPNLLRAIAEQGHNIGSHSDKHKPMVVQDAKTGRQVKTQNREEYSKDLATAVQKLQDVAGDVTINGKPALTRFFRPTALAISKMGFEELFATGYEYIISGSCNTSDYKAENVQQLVKTIKDGIYAKDGEFKKGSILVFHMLDSAKYTAISLDILLTANEAKADSDPSKFKVGRLSDYLTEGYSQLSRKN